VGRPQRLRRFDTDWGQCRTGYARTVTEITPYRDGPLLVRGPVTLRDQDGSEIVVVRETIALCRCGKSRMRPFCDGTHKVVKFRAPSGAEQRGA
jgi:CDGSH-type Zn-finger protein